MHVDILIIIIKYLSINYGNFIGSCDRGGDHVSDTS